MSTEHLFEKRMSSPTAPSWVVVHPPKEQETRSLFSGERKKMGVWLGENKLLLVARVFVLKKIGFFE